MALTKKCSDCNVEKDVTEFNTNGKGKAIKPFCKDCSKERNKKNRQKTRETNIKWRYGISYDDLLSMFEKQNGRCGICNTKIELFADALNKGSVGHIDHDHSSGEVRGLLCGNCNTGLGKFNDDVALLKTAIQYLRDNQC